MKRNKFSLSNYQLLSCKAGQLVPVGITEVLPGDTFRHSISCLARVAPLVHPIMHPTHIAFRSFFVPTRIIWDEFADHFITGGTDGEGDSSAWPYVTIPGGGYAVGSLADYLGVPTAQGATDTISALPFRAYAAIYNEYFRDKQIQAPLVIDTTSGADTTTSVALQNCDWEKDYFTSSRLDPQLGPDVTVALGTTAPVISDGSNPTFVTGSGSATGTWGLRMINGNSGMFYDGNPTADSLDVDFANSGLVANLAAATGISINDLREAFAQQSFQEHRSRFGDTFVEYLRYLGLSSSDARLQLPEYLGGFKETIQFSEVLSTNGATGGGLGTLGGHGIAAGRSGAYQRYFEEHGFVITLAYVRPKTIYSNGLPRMWSRDTKELYWQKEYEHTGQQEVLNKEVYLGHSAPDGVFGYQDVYDEYRRAESGIHGEFRSTLKDWHLAREDINTDGEATLDAAFVKCTPRTDIYAAPSADNMYLMVSHKIKARRLPASSGWSSNI